MIAKGKRKKIIKIKRKNPSDLTKHVAKTLFQNIDVDNFKYLSEGKKGDVYYFEVNNNTVFYPTDFIYRGVNFAFFNKKFKIAPGPYVLKVKKDTYVKNSIKEINHLKKLSKLGLIPRIIYIDKWIIIMRYIDAKPLSKIICKLSNSEFREILLKTEAMVEKWQHFGQVHGDLHEDNILVDDNSNIYFIDPSFTTDFDPEEDYFWLYELKIARAKCK